MKDQLNTSSSFHPRSCSFQAVPLSQRVEHLAREFSFSTNRFEITPAVLGHLLRYRRRPRYQRLLPLLHH